MRSVNIRMDTSATLPDGRMYAILAADNRIKPHGVPPTDPERVKLHQTMSAYAGTYTLDGEKVIHHVDISWTTRLGQEQIKSASIAWMVTF